MLAGHVLDAHLSCHRFWHPYVLTAIIIIIIVVANRRRKVQQRHIAPQAAAIRSMCDLGAQLTASWNQLYVGFW